MSNLTDLISAGGSGGGALFTIPVTKSTTWTPPFDGTAVIHVIGAGGSGAMATDNTLTGGGAGGYSKKTVTLSTGTNWTMVVGAGGLSTSGTGSGGNGTAGGNTTATDGTHSLTANGGAGGVKNLLYVSGAAAAGGTASGGSVNNTGGASGSPNYCSAGGAVGVLGTGNAGDNSGFPYASTKTGGHSDVQSPQFENTNGELYGGGRGGRSGYYGTGVGTTSNVDGEFLAGGGAVTVQFASKTNQGGNGGIGGGGGGAVLYPSSNQTQYVASGAGGNGLIIVMYTAIG